ncbi:hypothetical protein D3C73_1282920 [compost metagenome]
MAGARPACGVLGKTPALHFLDLAQKRDVNPGFVHDVTGGVGTSHHGGTEGLRLGNGVDGHIART